MAAQPQQPQLPAISPALFNAVGDSSILYGAQRPRLLPSDFRVRTLDGVADDRPLFCAELTPYYAESARRSRRHGCGSRRGATARPRRPCTPD
ncbi:hypothetical protein [Pseudonocardia spinosispora]|uniref:hypothetical protein n=1 Tax=Pseudonocardia spinosispora TaxID=103441 RepID=UPI000402B96A|nr:hypothetical protein [Pseudonocardia spinosispora]